MGEERWAIAVINKSVASTNYMTTQCLCLSFQAYKHDLLPKCEALSKCLCDSPKQPQAPTIHSICTWVVDTARTSIKFLEQWETDLNFNLLECLSHCYCISHCLLSKLDQAFLYTVYERNPRILLWKFFSETQPNIELCILGKPYREGGSNGYQESIASQGTAKGFM